MCHQSLAWINKDGTRKCTKNCCKAERARRGVILKRAFNGGSRICFINVVEKEQELGNLNYEGATAIISIGSNASWVLAFKEC